MSSASGGFAPLTPTRSFAPGPLIGGSRFALARQSLAATRLGLWCPGLPFRYVGNPTPMQARREPKRGPGQIILIIYNSILS